MSLRLTVVEGPYVGEKYNSGEGDYARVVVGRSPEATFPLDERDATLSRKHFIVELNPPHCNILDLESRHGTFINDAKIAPNTSTVVRHGDKIEAGKQSVFRIELASTATGDFVTPTDDPVPVDDSATLRSTAPPPFWFDHPPAIPNYQVVRKLGEGGMGVVYLAERASDRKPFAIKCVRPAIVGDGRVLQKFMRESQTLCALRHPHVVEFREQGIAGGMLYFVTEFVPGVNAAELVRAQPDHRLEPGRAVRLVRDTLDGLGHAHKMGFVHRDIKPANVLVEQVAGRAEFAKLADFGLARKYQESALSGLTVTGNVAGTAEFMPPEQIEDFRNVDPTADQFSAAATLYYLLTGELRYDVPPGRFLHAVINHLPPVALRESRPELPAELETVVMRAMSNERRERFLDANALRAALEPFADPPRVHEPA